MFGTSFNFFLFIYAKLKYKRLSLQPKNRGNLNEKNFYFYRCYFVLFKH